MKRKLSFGIKSLRKKTPLILFKIGNILLTLSTFVTTYEFYNNEPKMALYSLIFGVVGKTITELFSHES